MNINDIYETKILRLNNEGEGVAVINDIVVFIPYSLVGEIVRVKITKIYKNYAIGELIKIKEKSLNRIKEKCPYFYKCGGCNLMHMDYATQLEFKKEKIKSIFKKICNTNINLDKIYSYNTYNYRNKVVFKVKDNIIGFYKNKTKEIVDVKECMISDKKINDILTIFRKFIINNQSHMINELMIRTIDDKIMICIDKINKKLKDKFMSEFNNFDSIYINDKLVFGKEVLTKTLNNNKFNISNKSFFQINIRTCEKLYEKALSYVSESNISLDLYCGTGTITMLLANKSKKVIGVEVVKSAIKDAKSNMVLNNINNVEFICDKVENKIDELNKLDIDTIIMDPPRTGCDKKTLKSLLEIGVKQIIYISCNPITLARDYNILKEKYWIKEISGFDMFPNTYHVECVSVLSLKS